MVIDFRVRGLKCAYHKNEQAVASCDYCRKPICRMCVERGGGQGRYFYCSDACREAAEVHRKDESHHRKMVRWSKRLKQILKHTAGLLLIAAMISLLVYFIVYLIRS